MATDILKNAPAIGRTCDPRRTQMPVKGQRCEPGCECGLHNRRPCPSGCTCKKHDPQVRMCKPGCQCKRHAARPVQSAEEKAEKVREYRERNREKSREYARQYRAENPEKVRESYRKWRETHRDDVRQRNREWRAANRDVLLVGELRRRHNMTPEDWQAMWDAQGGRCYLCNDPLDGLKAVIEHDHDCCPQNKSCARCRRGLACGTCNTLVGFASDDPDRLQRIAANFGVAAAAAKQRIATPFQGELPIDIKRAARRREESA